ncbi:unnamed protein product [Rotaria sp. Silwood1]|nr:unnamed protein product [Rotaria sp. Silwood1]
MYIARRTIVVIVAVWIVLPIHNLIFNTANLNPNDFSHNIPVLYYHSIFSVTTGCILPASIMITCAFLTYHNLVLKQKRRQLMIPQQRGTNNDVCNRERKRDRQVLLLLIVQVVVFLITIIPWMCYQFYNALTLNSTNHRIVGENSSSTTTNNIGPYVHRRSGADINESNTPATLVTVTSSISAPTTNVTVTAITNKSDDSTSGSKRRPNIPPTCDEEVEGQRKYRSAQARRERRSTQCVIVEDINEVEQQIKNRSNDLSSSIPTIPQPLINTNELSNNKIGAPLTTTEHDIEIERSQRLIKKKRDKALRANNIPTITANDSLNLGNSSHLQQPRRRTNRVHNQRKNIGRIIWNDVFHLSLNF